MAVLIDPPRWPAHGTTFSHLVSDASLAELHEFAERAGVPRRAFDRDHYDVSAARYTELVDHGALPVSGGELIRRLRASGLRVGPRMRPEHVKSVLTIRWPTKLGGAAAVRDDLLERWSEPHRHYHGLGHLLAVLEAVDLLTEASPPLPVVLAAWFHDAVYAGVAGQDEWESAELAGRLLAGYLPAADIAETERLVLLTTKHDPSLDDRSGALLCDADLAVLGGTAAVYDRYVEQVRADYAHVDADAWRHGRAAVLRQLLALDPLYRTSQAYALWDAAARENLRRELANLGITNL